MRVGGRAVFREESLKLAEALQDRLFAEIVRIPLVDPHSHINPHAPVATTLNDLLAYHYYTELAHSAGLPKQIIESTSGFEQAERIVEYLGQCANTVQYSWLIELAREFFGFAHSELTPGNLRELFDASTQRLGNPMWPGEVCCRTNLEAVFLTNDFDDPLEGFDTRRYVPCLRTDELVFKLDQPSVRNRLASASGVEPSSWRTLEQALDRLFERFVARGARACAISLPPDFTPRRPTAAAAAAALEAVLLGKADADGLTVLAHAVFFALAERCRTHRLPFDLMIGVRRSVYPAGVYQGQDLFEKTTSLYQFRELFNALPDVVFPVSVLTHNQNQELVSYCWIFPNVVTSGHWWYSNVPAYIEADLRARLEAAPQSKQIGYYSDAYKLEFVLPKFNMYRRALAAVLARDFVVGKRWPEEKAIDLARVILRDNVLRIFGVSPSPP